MATSGTRDEGRGDFIRAKGKIVVLDISDFDDWDDKTIILTDGKGRSVTFTGDKTVHNQAPAKVTATAYTFGHVSAAYAQHVTLGISYAINLANANGDLSITSTYTVPGAGEDADVNLAQLATPATPRGDRTTIGGNVPTTGGGAMATITDFNVDIGEDLYIKSHVVAQPNFTLNHYGLDHVDANYNIDGTTTANPRQAPFSKRFQIIRGAGAGRTTTG